MARAVHIAIDDLDKELIRHGLTLQQRAAIFDHVNVLLSAVMEQVTEEVATRLREVKD